MEDRETEELFPTIGGLADGQYHPMIDNHGMPVRLQMMHEPKFFPTTRAENEMVRHIPNRYDYYTLKEMGYSGISAYVLDGMSEFEALRLLCNTYKREDPVREQ